MAGSPDANGRRELNTDDGLQFNVDIHPEPGRAEHLADGIVRLVAPNAGPYTFTGTNTYLIGSEPLFVLDPGPEDQQHFDAIVKAIDGRTVAAILLTHTHVDHSTLVPRLCKRLEAPIWFGGAHCLSRPKRLFEINVLAGSCDWRLRPDRTLVDGDQITAGAVALEVVATPGHCANHLSFGIKGQSHLFSGDHIMGWNSTLVATPDGDMGDYFASLDRLITADWDHYLPGHGDQISNGRDHARALKRHREMRNAQIVDAVSAGASRLADIVDTIYSEVPPATRRAAAMTVMAHIEHLARAGNLNLTWRWGKARISPV